MKRILVLTSIYPGPDIPASYTSIVHYFTHEWIKMGFDVKVIHTCNYFPKLYYMLPNKLRLYIEKKKGFALPEKRLCEVVDFELDGVKVHRVPMFKKIPGRPFSAQEMIRAKENIIDFLKNIDFRPDYIIGHWIIPQAVLLNELKSIYNCPVTLVLHDGGEPFRYYANSQELIDNIDLWGYRSESIKNTFEENYGKRRNSFRCYSGIPEIFLESVPQRTWKEVNKFIYVGMLIERKHPDKVISAVDSVYGDKKYHISIIGDGGMKLELQKMCSNKKCDDMVEFLGRTGRQKIIESLDVSDVFIMISEKEVFGLVYIEAMARGCIVIASKGEGMEGIIKNGVNGFLCKAGDVEELKDIIRRICIMSISERKCISEEAKKTAVGLTDKNVAEHYINSVLNLEANLKNNL